MGSEETLNNTTKQVLEFLLTQPATIDEVAKLLQKTPRTVYRAIKEIETLDKYTVVRTGPQTAYKFGILNQEHVHV
jgi:transcriptional antiterminator